MILELLWPGGTKSKITNKVAARSGNQLLMILELLSSEGHKSKITLDQDRSVAIGASELPAVGSRQ